MLFFKLINVKMPTIVGILTVMCRKNFMLSCIEHEKKFKTLGPGQLLEKKNVCSPKSSNFLQLLTPLSGCFRYPRTQAGSHKVFSLCLNSVVQMNLSILNPLYKRIGK